LVEREADAVTCRWTDPPGGQDPAEMTGSVTPLPEASTHGRSSTPFGSPRVRFVQGFQELAETPFAGDINALCWQRTLPGDFAEIVACLGDHGQPMCTLDPAMLRALPLSAAGSAARECLLTDLQRLGERGLAPVLDCIHEYPRDDRPGPIATDVFSFHVDSAPCATDTWLCTYHGPTSEGLCNEESRRLVDIPSVRADLLARYGGADDAGFSDFLTENAYDLHYRALPQASPYPFGVGNLWRIATAYPGCPVLPSIHRAPPTRPGDPPRLLLIS
jgi:hypothetical protein